MIPGQDPEATCLHEGCTPAKRVFLGKDRIPVGQSIHLEPRQAPLASKQVIQAGDSWVVHIAETKAP